MATAINKNQPCLLLIILIFSLEKSPLERNENLMIIYSRLINLHRENDSVEVWGTWALSKSQAEH
jgi:hypothetical protein